MKNILVSTYGTTWHLLAEVLGFTNPDDYPFYSNHPDLRKIEAMRDTFNIEPVSEVWMITSAAQKSKETIDKYRRWHRACFPKIALHSIFCASDNSLRTIDECRMMRDLIYRTVMTAHQQANGGQIILSMVGGFKTMGADLQEASDVFGCQALLHMLFSGDGRPQKETEEEDLKCPIDNTFVRAVTPIIVSGKKNEAAYLYKNDSFSTGRFPLTLDGENSSSTKLIDEIDRYKKQAEVILSNFSTSSNNKSENFRALSSLHPQIIEQLQSERIGVDRSSQNDEINWLKTLPKAELHCHFGGILSPAEMVDVALTEQAEVCRLANDDNNFSDWLSDIRRHVKDKDAKWLSDLASDKNKIRTPFAKVPEPISICGFLSEFANDRELLDKVIFGSYADKALYRKIGIAEYEKLGDLQGSALMQSEKCIRKACEMLRHHCQENKIRYLELRCSPINYTRGGLPGTKVVDILLNELAADRQDTLITLLFIASRHGKMSDVYRHVELCESLFEREKDSPGQFTRSFVGFDLAGAEGARSPRALKEAFEALQKRCLNLTIHAGETATAESIWEAVYCLNADRIGHGLTLHDSPELLNRLLNRGIALEMCPSSNFQICNFCDFSMQNGEGAEEYPLKEYLDKRLLVTVNTDDSGISRTDLTHEYLKAAQMSRGGLSKWEMLQLTFNAFTVSFAPFQVRKRILADAEREIMELIGAEYGIG